MTYPDRLRALAAFLDAAETQEGLNDREPGVDHDGPTWHLVNPTYAPQWRSDAAFLLGAFPRVLKVTDVGSFQSVDLDGGDLGTVSVFLPITREPMPEERLALTDLVADLKMPAEEDE